MVGTAETVFYGDKKEKFKVTILSIVENSEPRQNVILARFSGNNVEKSGIAEGMSGSPVYIHGKLIGAIAYTWPHLKEAVGGIQPIEQMLPVLKEPNYDVHALFKEKFVIGHDLNLFKNIKPIDVPLVINGFSPEGFQFVSNQMKNKGFIPLISQAGDAKNAPLNKNQKLEPGDAVGILFMSGDASAGAVGTVTYVDPKDPRKILIFGHPFKNLGYVEFPMTKAIVHYTMPSTEIAWKFAMTTDVVGTIYNDRQTAVAGKMGIFSSMVPVEIKVFDENNKDNPSQNFHYNIVSDGNFFPQLFAGAMVSSFSRFNGGKTQTVELNVSIKVKNLKTGNLDTLSLNHFALGESKDLMTNIGTFLQKPLEMLFLNFYNDIRVQKVTAQIQYVNQVKLAKIVNVVAENTKIAPGEKAKVRVILNTFKNQKESILLEIPIPNELKQPYLGLIIAGGIMSEENLQANYAHLEEPQNYEQFLQVLNKPEEGKNIVVYFDQPGITANIGGYVLKQLPFSQAYHYGIRMQGNKYFGAVRSTFSFPTNYIVLGELPVIIPIKLNKGDNL